MSESRHIRIDPKEAGHSAMTIVGFLAPTVEQAKKLADSEILKHGHVRTDVCTGKRSERGWGSLMITTHNCKCGRK